MEEISLYSVETAQRRLCVRRYYSVNHAYYEMAPHSHPEIEMMYASTGKCLVRCGDADHHLREGDYILLDGGIPHELSIARGSPCRVLNLEIGMIPAAQGMGFPLFGGSEDLQSMLRDARPIVLGQDGSRLIHSAVTSLQRLLQEDADGLQIDLQLELLLLEVARQDCSRYSPRSGSRTVYVKRAMHYLEEHFDRALTIAEVAEAAGASPSHLQRMFRSETGATLVETIHRLRLEKAKYLLETSTLPIVDIALGVGFNSRQHFTHIFTRAVGCSPASYRKNKGASNLWAGFHGDSGNQTE